MIRNQFAAAGMFDEHLSHRIFNPQIAERITAGEVKKARDLAQDLSLRTFPRPGGAEEENRAIFHTLGTADWALPLACGYRAGSNLYFVNLNKRNDDVRCSIAFGDLHREFVGQDAGQTVAHILAPG